MCFPGIASCIFDEIFQNVKTPSTPVSVAGGKGGWPGLPSPGTQTPQRSRTPDSQQSPLDPATITPTLYEVAEGGHV